MSPPQASADPEVARWTEILTRVAQEPLELCPTFPAIAARHEAWWNQALPDRPLFMANAIMMEAALSFLGLGVQPPTPSWGEMISSGRNYLMVAPHVATIPGLAIMLAVLGFNLLGDGLRDALDPKMKIA